MKLVAIDSVSKTTIDFGTSWTEERYLYWLGVFRADNKVHKVLKIDGENEEVLIER